MHVSFRPVKTCWRGSNVPQLFGFDIEIIPCSSYSPLLGAERWVGGARERLMHRVHRRPRRRTWGRREPQEWQERLGPEIWRQVSKTELQAADECTRPKERTI